MFGRKKQIPAYDSIFQAPDNVVDIPPPTEDDIRWARALDGKISNYEFIEICISNNLWRLEYCIQVGKKLNSNRFPLFCHIGYSNKPCPNVVKLLLAHGADPSYTASSALRVAIKKRYKDIAFVLFEYNVDIAKAKIKPNYFANKTLNELRLNTDDKIYLDRIYDEWQGRTLEDAVSQTPSADKTSDDTSSLYDITCPDPEVNLPAPTAEDIKWAEKYTDKKIKDKDVINIIEHNQLWRLQFALNKMPENKHKGEFVVWASRLDHSECIRIIFANGQMDDINTLEGYPLRKAAGSGSYKALETLYELGADLDYAIRYAGGRSSPVLMRFKEKQHAQKNTEDILENGEVWTALNDHTISSETVIETQFGPNNIVRTFNFQSRKIESFVQSETAISPPSSENFDTQPTETEIRQAHAELEKQGFSPPPLEEVLSSKRKADPVTVNLGTTRKQHP